MSCFNSFSESIEDETHDLLDPPSVAYSNVTVRRAFVVWMYCGQRNRFKDVCNYFHYLEALEEKLTAESRASSRHCEFDLFQNKPPTSTFLTRNFPKLYNDTQLQYYIAKAEQYKYEPVFKVTEFDKMAQRSGTSSNEIVEASKMIRNYCITHTKSLERFLKEFKEHTEKCGLTNTVGNVAFYIKRKIIQADIELEVNYAKTLELLAKHHTAAPTDAVEETSDKDVQDPMNNVLLKKRNSFNAVSSQPLTDKKHVRNKMADISHIDNDFMNKYQKFSMKNYHGEENNQNTITEDIFNKSVECEDSYSFRARRFSGSNFIKKDILTLRKI